MCVWCGLVGVGAWGWVWVRGGGCGCVGVGVGVGVRACVRACVFAIHPVVDLQTLKVKEDEEIYRNTSTNTSQ